MEAKSFVFYVVLGRHLLYDRAWVTRSSGEALLRNERLFFFLVIVLVENCQLTPAVTHAVPRSDVTSQGQVSRIVRTGTLGAVSSSFPAPTVRKVRVRGASGYGKNHVWIISLHLVDTARQRYRKSLLIYTLLSSILNIFYINCGTAMILKFYLGLVMSHFHD